MTRKLDVMGLEIVEHRHTLRNIFILISLVVWMLLVVFSHIDLQKQIHYNTQRIDILDDSFNNFMDVYLLKAEGGYVNDSRDNGGETSYGISHRANPDVDIKNLTWDGAKRIYFEKYYVSSQINKIESVKIRMALLDFFIHSGHDGIKQFQKVLNRDEDISIKVDGHLGGDSFDAIDTYVSHWDEGRLLQVLKRYRKRLMRRHSDYRYFGSGWTHRLNSLDNYIKSL